MQIKSGKTYTNTDPAAWPQSMFGVSITVVSIDQNASAHQLAVAYTFIDSTGRIGDGTMQSSYAQEFLRAETAQ